MHEAYHVTSLLKLSHQVESVAADGDTLLVGTRQGHLFMYNIITNETKCDLSLMRYSKSFSKKAVQQLEIIPEQNLLISLTDNLVSLHDINAINFTTLQQIQKSKGATFFAVNVKKQTSLTGDTSILARLAVSVKRKIQLYYLKNNEFLELMEDISLSDIPKSFAWCEEVICIAYRDEYALLELNGTQTDLFPTSSNSKSCEPYMIKINDSLFGLGRENQTVIVNTQGKAERHLSLKWSEVPVSLAWDEPYVFGVLNESIEVCTIEPSGLVQTLQEIPKVRFIVRAHQGLLMAASVSQIWSIQAVDIAKQREVLVNDKQFQLALKLTQISNESDAEKKERIQNIHTLLAYDLFAKKQFHESMKEFLKLGTDAYDVIRLFPDLLPQQGDYPEPTRDLTEKEQETSKLALIDYLTEMRRKIQSNSQAIVNSSGNLNDRDTSKSVQKLLQIIDTTLLKCYLQTNDALVAPLLRLGHCHLVEAEKILKKWQKYNELIILYQTKGQHRRALELLQSQKSVQRTVSYLQHLSIDNLGLILEFSDWVLKESPEEGLKIFTEDIAEIEALPRPRILDFLLKSHPSVVIPYLEHVVDVWKDGNPVFHNALIHQYREKLINDMKKASEITEPVFKPENSQQESVKKKLLQFLETSTHYIPESVLNSFPTDSLLEERAIMLGRMGKHEQALALYVRAMGDVKKGVEYCKRVYDQNLPRSKCVYVTLIKLILDPESYPLTLSGLTLAPQAGQPDIEAALQLLEENASRINPIEALAILPEDIPVSRIHKFLMNSLHKVIYDRRRAQLLKGLLYAEHLQCQETKLALQSQSVLVTELNVCQVCKKRFGNQSALVRYPNGEVVHYSCHERKM